MTKIYDFEGNIRDIRKNEKYVTLKNGNNYLIEPNGNYKDHKDFFNHKYYTIPFNYFKNHFQKIKKDMGLGIFIITSELKNGCNLKSKYLFGWFENPTSKDENKQISLLPYELPLYNIHCIPTKYIKKQSYSYIPFENLNDKPVKEPNKLIDFEGNIRDIKENDNYINYNGYNYLIKNMDDNTYKDLDNFILNQIDGIKTDEINENDLKTMEKDNYEGILHCNINITNQTLIKEPFEIVEYNKELEVLICRPLKDFPSYNEYVIPLQNKLHYSTGYYPNPNNELFNKE